MVLMTVHHAVEKNFIFTFYKNFFHFMVSNYNAETEFPELPGMRT